MGVSPGLCIKESNKQIQDLQVFPLVYGLNVKNKHSNHEYKHGYPAHKYLHLPQNVRDLFWFCAALTRSWKCPHILFSSMLQIKLIT